MSEVNHNPLPGDRADRLTDENLKHMGAHMLPPAEPCAGALERWKRGTSDALASAPGPHAAPTQGARLMRNPRIMTLFGAGSAVAAAFGICTFFFWQSAGTQVEASTIFTSLGNAMSQAFKMTFANVATEGLVTNGSVTAAFPDDETGGDTPLVQVDMHIEGANDSAEYAGLDLVLHGELLPDSKWVYLKTVGLPAAMLEEVPFLSGLQQMAQNGLILDLSNLPHDDDENTPGDDGEESADGDNTIGIMLGETETPEDGNSLSFSFSLGASSDAEETDASGNSAVVKSESSIIIQNESTDDEVGELIEDIITRDASPDQIAAFVALLQGAANDTSVEPQGGGRHLLTASDFDFDELADEDPADIEWLDTIVLQVSYHETDGVEWALIDHVGDNDGTVRLDLVNITLDEDDMGMQSYVDDGVQVWDVGSLVALFGALTE